MTMALTLACPSCGKQFTVPDSAAGKRGHCPSCSTELQIPGIPAPEPKPEPSPEDSDPATAPPGESRECPYCSETILASARKCRHCGEYLDQELRQTAGPPGSGAEPPEVRQARSTITGAFIACLVSFFFCGVLAVVVQPFTIYFARRGARVLRGHGRTDGLGMAKATQVIGWIIIGLSVLVVVVIAAVLIAENT
jgi:hypothetical protein